MRYGPEAGKLGDAKHCPGDQQGKKITGCEYVGNYTCGSMMCTK